MSDFLSDLGKGIVSTVSNGVINTGLGLLGQGIVNKQARENYQWQYDNFLSPKAQVKALTAAGLNPAAVFGNNAPVLNSGGISVSSNPLGGIGTTSLSDLANYINAKANAKKAGVEMKNIEVETQAKQFDLDLAKIYKSPQEFAALTMAWKNVMLADDEHNIKVWSKAKEKALSEVEEKNRDMLQKTLDNMDTVIMQENQQRVENIKLTQEKQKTEKSTQTANRASANAANAAAKASTSQSALTDSQKVYQDIINGAERATSHAKRINLLKRLETSNVLSEEEQKKARLMINRYDWLIKEKQMTKAQDYFDYMMWYWKNETPDIDFDIPLAVPIK